MVGQPNEPSPEPPPAGRNDAHEPDPERFGPLALQRLEKDDGRSLIIYGRAERPS